MYLGIDTSNYTTSLALFDGQSVVQRKKPLTVAPGARGLRQSEALFQHTQNLPELFAQLPLQEELFGVGVSTRPRNVEGSYMPCFLAGVSAAGAAAAAARCPLHETSHQAGHVLAALYSCGRLDLVHKKFLAFHVSGGTTDALLVEPDPDNVVQITEAAASTDLKAGQLIDRIGVRLGFGFPCGQALDDLAVQSTASFKIKPSMAGANCSLSGVENKAVKMIEQGAAPCDVACFVIEYIKVSLDAMLQKLLPVAGCSDIVFAGGVMSNSIISAYFKEKYGALFASPQFSCDNAAGTAVYAYLKSGV